MRFEPEILTRIESALEAVVRRFLHSVRAKYKLSTSQTIN